MVLLLFIILYGLENDLSGCCQNERVVGAGSGGKDMKANLLRSL